MKLGEYLKGVIRDRDIQSLRQAAARITRTDGTPIAHMTLARIINDGHTNLDADTIVAIARFCGVPARLIFDMIDDAGAAMPYEHAILTLMSISDKLKAALLDLADLSRTRSIPNEDLNDIGEYIRFKIEKLKQPVHG